MKKIWITSDTHFCHNKDFLYAPRGFSNEWDMNKAIIENWNKIIDPDDDVYHLGDVMLNNNEEGIKCLKSLKGHIRIIRGNHDSETRIQLYKECWNVVEVIEGKFLNYKNYHFFLSHFPCITSNYDVDKPLKARMISLCGHSHTQDKWQDFDKGLIYHCELDCHNNKPILIDDIIIDIQKKIKENYK